MPRFKRPSGCNADRALINEQGSKHLSPSMDEANLIRVWKDRETRMPKGDALPNSQNLCDPVHAVDYCHGLHNSQQGRTVLVGIMGGSLFLASSKQQAASPKLPKWACGGLRWFFYHF